MCTSNFFNRQMLLSTNLLNAIKTKQTKTKKHLSTRQILPRTTSKRLFNITKTVLGKPKASPLPTSIPPPEIPQRFSDFFTGRIIAIRNNLDSQTVPLPAVSHHRFPGTPVTDFQPVFELTVKPSYRSPLSNL